MEDELMKMEMKKSHAIFDEMRVEILGKASSVMELHAMDVYYAIERCCILHSVAYVYGYDEFERDVSKLAKEGSIREDFIEKCIYAVTDDITEDSIMKMLEVYEKYTHDDLNDYIYLIYMRAIDMIIKGVQKDTFRFILMSFIPYEYRTKFKNLFEKRGV